MFLIHFLQFLIVLQKLRRKAEIAENHSDVELQYAMLQDNSLRKRRIAKPNLQDEHPGKKLKLLDERLFKKKTMISE